MQNVPFRKKIVVDVNRSVKAQVGAVQRGQWVFLSGMNCRILNIVGNLVIVLRFDRKTGERQVVQYA